MATPVLDKLAAQDSIKIRDIAGQIRELRFTECKLIKASNTGKAAIMISPDIIDISAPDRDDSNKTVGISVVGNSGTVIRGPVGFAGVPSDIRISALWKFNDLLLSCMPSTIMTPIPVLRFSLPLGGVNDFIQAMAAITALTAASAL